MIERYRNINRIAKISAFLVLAVITVMSSLSISGATVAYKVNYEGKVIATVKTKQQFSDAIDVVKQQLNAADIDNAISEPTYNAALVHSSLIDSEEVVVKAIIDNTDEIVEATALYVNGELLVCGATDTINSNIELCLGRFNVSGANCNAEFIDDVALENGYYLAADVMDELEVKQKIATLAVKTVVNVATDSAIAYETVTKKTDTQLIGYSSVLTPGKVGTRRLTETVTFINGVETGRVTVSDEVVADPVNEVVVVGTAKSTASAGEKQFAKRSGFLFPLPKGSWKVSSYYGDGRNHKGVDICADRGVSIFAVADGTVVYSGWRGGYGYMVEIKHTNGLVTRYAHASVLCASVGEKVSAGDVIAKVGSTGNSSGNHLHFEVLKNGRNVDPSPYIGLA